MRLTVLLFVVILADEASRVYIATASPRELISLRYSYMDRHI
jgi:hypothetical protein